MKTVILSGLIGLCLATVARAGEVAPAWRGYAGDAQHTARAHAATQPLAHVRWSTRVDLHPPAGGAILNHYASPMITAANTVLVPVKTGVGGGFRIDARSGATGDLSWRMTTSYVLPPHDWTPSFPAHLTAQNRLYLAGPGGTVLFRDTPDQASGASGQLAFFGLANYQADPSTYDANVMISTPITADDAGDIFFGFVVLGSTPLGLKSGVARIGADGQGSWISAVDAAGDENMNEVPTNCAPAISHDQKTVYIAISNGANGYLVGLNSRTLKPRYKAFLTDPVSTGHGPPSAILDVSSASPTVGPDGDVYYGVLEASFSGHNDRGWLLHFDRTLAQRKVTGSFGWDDTVSIVPASAVPAYTGASSYLLMTKYNNYYGIGGDGKNRIAILDPQVKQRDSISGLPVMKEVMTVLSPHHVPDQPKGARYEWCINSAAVDAARQSVFVNNEDGHLYRWDLATGELAEDMDLNQPIFEAYTPTLIGPDGMVYAINNAILYAVGN